MKISNLVAVATLASLTGLAGAALAQTSFTVENGSMALTTGNIAGWQGLATSTESRDGGAFNATVAHQAIDSPGDPNQGSGSLLLTLTAASGSVTQQILLTTAGQTMEEFSLDIAHDGQCLALIVGLYEENTWDVLAGGAVDIIAAPVSVPADTDGTLDTFTTVTIPSFTVGNSSGNPMRVFVGTSATGGYGMGAVGATVAIDNVRVGSPSSVNDWTLY